MLQEYQASSRNFPKTRVRIVHGGKLVANNIHVANSNSGVLNTGRKMH